MTTVSGDGPRTPTDGFDPAEPHDAPPDAFYDTRPVAGLPLSAPGTDPSSAPAPAPGGRAARRNPPRPPRAGTPSPAGRVILPIALAAVSVVALVAGWNRLQADQAAVAAPAPAASSAAPSTPAPSSPAPSSPAPSSPSAPPATSAPASPAASPSPAASSAPAASASPTRPPASPSASATVAFTVDRSVPVTVLNGTTRPGLAAAVAADLEAKGWRIVSTGNWLSGGIESTTVFVDGERNAALTMRQDLPAADATRAPIGAMKDGRITIVLLDDYPR